MIAITEEDVWQVRDGLLFDGRHQDHDQPPCDSHLGPIVALAACTYEGVDTDPESRGPGPLMTRLAVEYASGAVYTRTGYGKWVKELSV